MLNPEIKVIKFAVSDVITTSTPVECDENFNMGEEEV